ncbi:glycosyltransferase family 4 protein (plasmid) [Rhizobium sp. WL3]|uniref:glycosyltransferase family 4 protein n=1 Tax=Rhizobium sp. WL3 TaxID=2603277 RepID=UPI0011C1DC2F|nr:glycosyltransferase family 4 protein [Rhizobium sp. WL3]QEE43683.1 glycosyltransferase family 4 protein [Rhizobium sp. WL3]
MNILHVNHLLDPVRGGGTAERAFQLSKELAQKGHQCTLLTMDIGETHSRAAGVAGLHVIALPCLNFRFFVPRVSRKRIDAIVSGVDVVQIFGNWTILNLLVWLACKRLGKPLVFCPAGALPAFGRSQFLKSLYTRYVSRGILRDAMRCVCITDDERKQFLSLGAASSKLVTIPNGIDPAQYRLPDMVEKTEQFRTISGGAPILFYLGRLNPIKGPDLLLEAFIASASRWPDHHLVYGGPDGGMLAALKERAASCGLNERVHFIGFVDIATKAVALHAAQLLIIPSRSEAMSIVVLEAGACGCPALFTDTCGLEDFQRQDAGVMVSADPRSIAAALDELLGDPIRLREMGHRLKELVMTDFLWQRQASKHGAMYADVVAGSTLMTVAARA